MPVRIGSLIMLVLSACGYVASTPTYPDIIIVTVDSLRADRIGQRDGGPSLTPAIDRLAARGVSFRNATVTIPRTTPGLASLMTGLWPQHHGSREVRAPIKHGAMLAEVLRSHGYATFAYSTSPMAAESQGFHKGFDEFNQTGSSAAGVTEFLLSVVSGSEPEVPRFVWAHYMEPHWPYGDDVSDRTSACWKLGARVAKGELTWGGLQGNAGGFAQEALADCKIMYDRDVAAVDREIGELLEGLETRDRKNGAIVVFTADHGENLGEEGLYYEHGPSLHDASVLVPLVVVAPQLPEGVVVDSPIQLEDLMPTILSLAAIPASGFPIMDGTDRTAQLAAGGEEDLGRLTFLESAGALKVGQPNFLRSGRVAGLSCLNWDRFSLCSKDRSNQYFLYDHEADPGLKTDVSADHPDVVASLQRAAERWPPEQARSRAVRSASFKLVERPVLDGGYERVLYDLRSDPEELNDVSGAHPEVFRRLGESLDGWVQSLSQGHQLVEERDEEALEQLRALGYVN